jgi:hypothetical protein
MQRFDILRAKGPIRDRSAKACNCPRARMAGAGRITATARADIGARFKAWPKSAGLGSRADVLGLGGAPSSLEKRLAGQARNCVRRGSSAPRMNSACPEAGTTQFGSRIWPSGQGHCRIRAGSCPTLRVLPVAGDSWPYIAIYAQQRVWMCIQGLVSIWA